MHGIDNKDIPEPLAHESKEHHLSKSSAEDASYVPKCKIDFGYKESHIPSKNRAGMYVAPRIPTGALLGETTITFGNIAKIGDAQSPEEQIKNFSEGGISEEKSFIYAPEGKNDIATSVMISKSCASDKLYEGHEIQRKSIEASARTSDPQLIKKLQGLTISIKDEVLRLDPINASSGSNVLANTQTVKIALEGHADDFFELQVENLMDVGSYGTPSIYASEFLHYTAAHKAAFFDKYDDLLEALKQDPASLNAKSPYGHTPLSLAIISYAPGKTSKCIDYLMGIKEATEFYSVNFSNGCYIDCNDPNLEKADRCEVMGCVSPLTAAIAVMNPNLVKRLIDTGSPLQYKLLYKHYIFILVCRAVHNAYKVGNCSHDYIFKNNLRAVVDALLEHDRELIFSLCEPHTHKMVNGGVNALQMLSLCSKYVYELADYLLQSAKTGEIDWFHKDDDGMNIFISTIDCSSINPNFWLIKLFLENGAHVALNDPCDIKSSPDSIRTSGRFTALEYVEHELQSAKAKCKEYYDYKGDPPDVDSRFVLQYKSLKKIRKLFIDYNPVEDVSTHISDSTLTPVLETTASCLESL